MNFEKTFKGLLVSHFILLIAFLIIDFDQYILSTFDLEPIMEGSQQFIGSLFNNNPLFFLLFTTLIFVNIPLLFFFIRFSRELFLFTIILTISLSTFGGFLGDYSLGSELLSSIDYISSLIEGALLALMYLSPLKDRWGIKS